MYSRNNVNEMCCYSNLDFYLIYDYIQLVKVISNGNDELQHFNMIFFVYRSWNFIKYDKRKAELNFKSDIEVNYNIN